MDISPGAVERLQRQLIYPVVIFLKLKNWKQLKELKEEKISSKQAKEIFEQTSKFENEYSNLITTPLLCTHTNIKYVCQQIKCAVEHEQKKTLWIISKLRL